GTGSAGTSPTARVPRSRPDRPSKLRRRRTAGETDSGGRRRGNRRKWTSRARRRRGIPFYAANAHPPASRSESEIVSGHSSLPPPVLRGEGRGGGTVCQVHLP